MQTEFESRLHADVRALVLETERLIGSEITVVLDPSRAARSPNEPGRMGCDMDACSAQILIGDAAYFPDASVYHELQHIRRILVERVPRLVVPEDFEPWTPQLATAMTRLDNNLEHLTIVPTEIARYPDRRRYWIKRVQRLIASLDKVEPRADRHRFAKLALLLAERMLADSNLRRTITDVLRQFGILEEAERYCAEATAALASKELLVRITFKHFELPTSAGCFEYLDPSDGSTRIAPL